MNVLCDNALLTGYALGRNEIDTGIIREVAEDLSITTNPEGPRIRPMRQVVNNTNGNSLAQGVGVVSAEARSGIARLEPKLTAARPIPKSLFSATVVPATFLDALATALTDAMGPMSKIVLRDQIKTLGESFEKFPHAKVDTLVETVSREVLDEGMRAQFRHKMLEQIKALKTS